MLKCWDADPKQRPIFQRLTFFFRLRSAPAQSAVGPRDSVSAMTASNTKCDIEEINAAYQTLLGEDDREIRATDHVKIDESKLARPSVSVPTSPTSPTSPVIMNPVFQAAQNAASAARHAKQAKQVPGPAASLRGPSSSLGSLNSLQLSSTPIVRSTYEDPLEHLDTTLFDTPASSHPGDTTLFGTPEQGDFDQPTWAPDDYIQVAEAEPEGLTSGTFPS